MAIHAPFADLLFQAVATGRTFPEVATIGRLGLDVARSDLSRLSKRYSVEVSADVSRDQFADGLLKHVLRVERLSAFDISDYEDCNYIHDFNTPVSEDHHRQYDAVIDAGSLEHIFNLPIALSNYMQMLRPGGTIFLCTVANNHMGHGLYQFSPEFFYRVFYQANGFRVDRMHLVEHRYPQLFSESRVAQYTVVDPVDVGRRVTLVSKRPVQIMVQATRVAAVTPFQHPTVQSDYASPEQFQPQESSLRSAAIQVLRFLPDLVEQMVYGHRELRRASFSNRSCYRRVS